MARCCGWRIIFNPSHVPKAYVHYLGGQWRGLGEGTFGLPFIITGLCSYLNLGEFGGKSVNVRLVSDGGTSTVGMLQSFLWQERDERSVNVLHLGARIYNEQVGQWLFSRFCKQGNILERLSLLCCSGFCKIISGASPCLSLGVGQWILMSIKSMI